MMLCLNSNKEYIYCESEQLASSPQKKNNWPLCASVCKYGPEGPSVSCNKDTQHGRSLKGLNGPSAVINLGEK